MRDMCRDYKPDMLHMPVCWVKRAQIVFLLTSLQLKLMFHFSLKKRGQQQNRKPLPQCGVNSRVCPHLESAEIFLIFIGKATVLLLLNSPKHLRQIYWNIQCSLCPSTQKSLYVPLWNNFSRSDVLLEMKCFSTVIYHTLSEQKKNFVYIIRMTMWSWRSLEFCFRSIMTAPIFLVWFG